MQKIMAENFDNNDIQIANTTVMDCDNAIVVMSDEVSNEIESIDAQRPFSMLLTRLRSKGIPQNGWDIAPKNGYQVQQWNLDGGAFALVGISPFTLKRNGERPICTILTVQDHQYCEEDEPRIEERIKALGPFRAVTFLINHNNANHKKFTTVQWKTMQHY